MGLIKLSVSEVTMPENAPPMSTPTAISITLPRRANALNCEMKFFMWMHPFVCFFCMHQDTIKKGSGPVTRRRKNKKTAGKRLFLLKIGALGKAAEG